MKLTGKHRYIIIAGVLAFVSGCNSKSDSDKGTTAAGTTTSTTDDDDNEEEEEEEVITSNALSGAFPGTLALSVFPQEGGTSLRLGDATKEESFDPNALSIKDKVAEQEKIASGQADSCLPSALGKQFTKEGDESCYEFDQDMLFGTNDTNQTSPNWMGTRNGKSLSGEACLVSFTRNQVSQVVAMVDQTLGFGMAAICQHRKLNGSSVALPEVGGTLDLKPALADLVGDKVTVNSASLERLDDANDRPVYRILISAAMGQDAIERTVGIIHSPLDDENKEYSGTLYTVMEGVPSFEAPAGGNQPPQNDKYQLLSITYARSEASGSKKLVANLRSAQMDPELAASAINSSGVLNLNVGTNVATGTMGQASYGNYDGFTQSNDAVDGITYIAFDLDADTNEGSLAYWKNPGGNYYENARGFNISMSKNATTGIIEGCATTGAASTDFSNGISVRRYLNDLEAGNNLTLSPKGFWHPFMNGTSGPGSDEKGDFYVKNQMSGQVTKWYKPAISDATLATTFATQQNGSLITRQCFKRNEVSGLYEIDTAQIDQDAGFEILDTGNAVNAAKFIALPGAVPPPVDNVVD